VISELLPGYVIGALEENEENFPDLLGGAQVTYRQVLAACNNFRIAGIGELFVTGRAAHLHRRLHQSARLLGTVLPTLPGSTRATGRARPFIDAVAANDDDAALTIASLCKRNWTKGEEFEEDFLFHEILMQRFFLGASSPACRPMLVRYEKTLGGTDDARLDVLRSLIDPDTVPFKVAVATYLKERAHDLAEKENSGGIAGDLLATEWHLSVEGIALTRLARRLSLPTDRQFLHVPAVALELPTEDWGRSNWRRIDPIAV